MKTPGNLRERVTLVTGAANGIGRETAVQLARAGARVAIVDHDTRAVDQLAAELGDEHTLALGCDVTDRQGMRDALAQVAEHFGRLDVVVANAGITPHPGTVRMLDPAEFDTVMAVNLTGVLNTVHPAIEPLRTTGGHIVVVSSCAAYCPPLGGAAYMVSKAAVEQLSRAFSLELAPHGISVTTAYFGLVETQLARATLNEDPLGRQVDERLPAPLRRRITAEQAARVVASSIGKRSPSTTAPRRWLPLSLLRGMLNPLLDRYLRADRWTHDLIRKLEHRTQHPR